MNVTWAVLGLVRDSRTYLDFLTSVLGALEARIGAASMEYFFYENDSVDDSAEMLRKFLSTRRGRLVSETLGAPCFGRSENPARPMFLAQYRNRIRDVLLRQSNAQWTLVVDTDIYFSVEHILEYQQIAKADPTIGMITPFCLNRDHRYYDTWAFEDLPATDLFRGQHDYPLFSNEIHRRYEHCREPVDVGSAFGGLVAVRTDLLRKAWWRSSGECEHKQFCHQLRRHGRIVMLPWVKPMESGEGNPL